MSEQAEPKILKPVPAKGQTPDEFEAEELSKEQYKGVTLKDIQDESKSMWTSDDGTVAIDTAALRASEEYKAMMSSGKGEGEEKPKSEEKSMKTEEEGKDEEQKEEGSTKASLQVELDTTKVVEEQVEEPVVTQDVPVVEPPKMTYNLGSTSLLNTVTLGREGPFHVLDTAPNMDLLTDVPRKDEMFKDKYKPYFFFSQRYVRPMKVDMLSRSANGYEDLSKHNISGMLEEKHKLAIDEIEVTSTRPTANATILLMQAPNRVNTSYMANPYATSQHMPRVYPNMPYDTTTGPDYNPSKVQPETTAPVARITYPVSLNAASIGTSNADGVAYTHVVYIDPFRLGLAAHAQEVYKYFFLTPADFFNNRVVSQTLRNLLSPRITTTEKDVLSDDVLERKMYPRFSHFGDANCSYYYKTGQQFNSTPRYDVTLLDKSIEVAATAFASISGGQPVVMNTRSTIRKITDVVPQTLYRVAGSEAKSYVHTLGTFLVGGYRRQLSIDFTEPEADNLTMLAPMCCVAHLCLLDLDLVDKSVLSKLLHGMLLPFCTESQPNAPQNGMSVLIDRIVNTYVAGGIMGMANNLPNMIRNVLKPTLTRRAGSRDFVNPRVFTDELARLILLFLGNLTRVRFNRNLGAPALYNFDVNNVLTPFAPPVLGNIANLRNIVLFGTQQLPVELFKADAANQALPLMDYVNLLSKLTNIGDAHTVVGETMYGHAAHARANLIFSRAIIRGSERMECIPWRNRIAGVDDLDTMHLPFVGALSYMMYGVDSSDPLTGILERESIYQRLDSIMYPSLYPAYIFFERAVATEVYKYFEPLGRARNFNYIVLKKEDMIAITINVIKNYYTAIDSDAETRIDEMFTYPATFFTPNAINYFVVPNVLKRFIAWTEVDNVGMPELNCLNTTVIHSSRPYGNMFLQQSAIDREYITPGNLDDIDIDDYVNIPAITEETPMRLFPKFNYFNELLRIDQRLLPRAFISVDEPIEPLRYYDNDRQGHLIYAYYKEVPQNVISLETIIIEMFPLNNHDTSFTIATIREAARLYRRRMNQNFTHVLLDKADLKYSFVEDTSYKNDIVEAGSVSVSLKSTHMERKFEISNIPIYYRTILDEYARETELTNPLGGVEGLASSINDGLSVFLGVYIGDIQYRLVNIDGRVLNERDAFNHHKDRNDQYHSISGNRIMTNNGVLLSAPAQIATRLKEEYKVSTDLTFRD